MRTNKFSVITEQDDNNLSVHLQGELDLAAAGEFRVFMEPIANDESINLTLDLAQLTYIDSTGIGILISILKIRNAKQSKLSVANVPAHIQRLFDMTGISKFFSAAQ